MMKTTRPRSNRMRPSALLRWVFLKAGKVLSCEIRVNNAHSHDVCVVPHWDVAAAVVERSDNALSALERHAQIAASLRNSGWTLVREPDGYQATAA